MNYLLYAAGGLAALIGGFLLTGKLCLDWVELQDKRACHDPETLERDEKKAGLR